MQNKDVIDMAQRCVEEIKMLRTEIDNLRPKAHAYESITAILGLLPKPTQGYGEDIVWRLNRQIAELNANTITAEETPDAK